jgi:hypothetical protein
MYKFHNSALYITSGNALLDQTVSGAIKQLNRIQSVSLGLNFSNVASQYLAGNGESITVDRPTASINLQYLLSNSANETALALPTGIGGNISKIIDEEKDLYIVYMEDGLEPNSYAGNDGSKFKIVSAGNVLLTNYSIKADVGSPVEVSCGFQALNLVAQTGMPSGQQIPQLDLANASLVSGNYVLPIGNTGNNSVAAIIREGITMNFPSGGIFGVSLSGENSIILQNFDFNMNLNRANIKSLGNALPKRPLQFPIEITLNTTAILDRYRPDQSFSTICGESGINFNIVLNKPCSNTEQLRLNFSNMVLESQSFSNAIGSLPAVDLSWRGYIYNFS